MNAIIIMHVCYHSSQQTINITIIITIVTMLHSKWRLYYSLGYVNMIISSVGLTEFHLIFHFLILLEIIENYSLAILEVVYSVGQ